MKQNNYMEFFELLNVWNLNSPGLGPVGVIRSSVMCFWNFDIDHFHWPQTFPIFRIILDFFCNRSQLKQQFELKPDLSQTSARSQPDLSQTSARFELNWVELSLTLLLLLSRQRAREAAAFIKNNKRRRLWEPLDPCIIRHFQIGAPFFSIDFRKGFFLKNDAKWSPRWPRKGHKIQ